ncbi:MAG: hypothetical protein WDM92_10435 [Caulobacteraceae bacterium]
MLSARRPELWRTTTFRLTLLYGAVFSAGVIALLALIYLSAAGYLTRQMDLIVLGQARALQSAPPAVLPALVRQAEAQDVRNVNFYGLYAPDGRWIAGNVRRVPADIPLDGAPRAVREPGAAAGGAGPGRAAAVRRDPVRGVRRQGALGASRHHRAVADLERRPDHPRSASGSGRR